MRVTDSTFKADQSEVEAVIATLRDTLAAQGIKAPDASTFNRDLLSEADALIDLALAHNVPVPGASPSPTSRSSAITGPAPSHPANWTSRGLAARTAAGYPPPTAPPPEPALSGLSARAAAVVAAQRAKAS